MPNFDELCAYNLYSYETSKDCFFNFVNHRKCITLWKQDEIIEYVIEFAQVTLGMTWKKIMSIPSIHSYFKDEKRTGSIYTKNYIRFERIDTWWKKNTRTKI